MDDPRREDDGTLPGNEADGDEAQAGRADAPGGSRIRQVPHAELTREGLPHPREPFDEVVRFAYGFDGYEHFGMRMCGEMANRAMRHYLDGGDLPGWLEGDLDRLRGCLYFEARRWILLAREPDTRSLVYVHRLIEAVSHALGDDEALRRSDPRGGGAPAR